MPMQPPELIAMFHDLHVSLRLLPTGELKAHPPLLTEKNRELLRAHEKELVKYIRHRAELRSAHQHDPRFSAAWPESNEASKILENDRSRDRAMVSSMNREAAFVAIARRSGLRTQVEVPRNGCSEAEMAALLGRFAHPATIQ